MRETRITMTGGVGLPGALGIAFVVLRLCGVIRWRWLWVLAPFWMPLALMAVVLIVAGMICGLVRLLKRGPE